MTRPIIFLDLDGPIISWYLKKDIHAIPPTIFPMNSRFNPATAKLMRELCEETGAKIVTNSTHNSLGSYHIKTMFYFNDMIDLLNTESACHTVFRNHERYYNVSRAAAVENYIDQYGIDNFVCFDDDIKSYMGSDDLRERSIQSPKDCLKHKHFRKAREILTNG